MQAVAEREIDDAVSSSEGHGGFGPFGGQRVEAGTDSSSEDDAKSLFEHEDPIIVYPRHGWSTSPQFCAKGGCCPA
jgi:hypothetical protein